MTVMNRPEQLILTVKHIQHCNFYKLVQPQSRLCFVNHNNSEFATRTGKRMPLLLIDRR